MDSEDDRTGAARTPWRTRERPMVPWNQRDAEAG
jgi:hypothetical protein